MFTQRIGTLHLELSNFKVISASSYNATRNDCILLVDTSGGSIDINLTKEVTHHGHILIIKDVSGQAGTNFINVIVDAPDHIDGIQGNTYIIDYNYGCITLVRDRDITHDLANSPQASGWWIISQFRL